MRSIPVSLLLLSCATTGLIQAAEDPIIWNPRVAVGYAPALSRVGGIDFKDKGGVSVALGTGMKQTFPDNWGYAVGADIFYTYGKADGDEAAVSDVTVKSHFIGLKVETGPTYNFRQDLSLGLMPYLGVAYARFNFDGTVAGGASGSHDDNGIALIYGAKLALNYAFPQGVRLGVYAGIEGTSTQAKNKDTDDKYNANGLGPVAGVVFGWVF
jgi:hypothetical protein